MAETSDLKPLHWLGSTREDLQNAPEEVRSAIGFALYEAQRGAKHPKAKPLKGFGGAGVLEVVANHDGDTWRAVYTVKIADAVYVLHFFQKKSRSGKATPKHEIDLVRRRLREVQDQAKKERP
jgi:phage-related protein